MRPVGIFEAKQKLSELVERASGERIGITRRGKLAAEISLAGRYVKVHAKTPANK